MAFIGVSTSLGGLVRSTRLGSTLRKGVAWCLQVLYNAVMENNCSEQAARMSAMENSTKNATEILEKLTLTYNRYSPVSVSPNKELSWFVFILQLPGVPAPVSVLCTITGTKTIHMLAHC